MNPSASSPLRQAVSIGLIAGASAILLCLVGMVEAFAERDIIAGVISMGLLIVVLIALVAGYLAAQRSGDSARGPKLASAGVAGLIVGLMVAALLLVGTTVNLRTVLISASPVLFELLSFGLPTGAAAATLTLAGGVIGLLGGVLQSLSPELRRRVTVTLVAVASIGLLQELIRVILSRFPVVPYAVGWMFGRQGQKGLSIPGVIAVSLAVYALQVYAPRWQQRARARSVQSRRYRLTTYAIALALLLLLPQIVGPYMSEVLNQVGLFILMGLGLNIVVGFAGLLDLGYVAFFAIGAYTMGVFTSTSGEILFHPEWGFWPALILAVVIAVFFGLLLGVPVLKMRGDYLAIVTLGFGEMIRIMALSDFLKPVIGGSQGIVQVAPIEIKLGSVFDISLHSSQSLFYLILIGCVLAAFVAFRLKDSRLGRAWMAVREDEDVAQAMGLNLVVTKLLAFGTGAAFAGLSGAIFASKLGTIYPHSFQLLISLNVLSLIILGGMGSIPGVVIGAFALVGVPELLREFAEYRLMVYGAVLVGMMLLRPAGLLPEEAHKRELLETESPPVPEAGAAGKAAP